MACLCEKVAGKDINLSPTCIGNLWIFDNIEPTELEALSREALRKKSAPGQALFMQGDPTDEMFLIKGGLVKLSKVLEDGTELTLDILISAKPVILSVKTCFRKKANTRSVPTAWKIP